MLPQQDLTITVKEARKLLGASGESLSDDQITKLIQTLTDMADIFLYESGSINYTGSGYDS